MKKKYLLSLLPLIALALVFFVYFKKNPSDQAVPAEEMVLPQATQPEITALPPLPNDEKTAIDMEIQDISNNLEYSVTEPAVLNDLSDEEIGL